MYIATIHTVSIVSPGVTIEEEHIAREPSTYGVQKTEQRKVKSFSRFRQTPR